MIFSFRDAETEKVFHNEVSRKLLQLHASVSLLNLRVPPGNRLEALKGRRTGEHSIRINDQWRLRFVWQEADEQQQTPAGARDVEIVDYH